MKATPTTNAISDAIENLRSLLNEEYKSDFSLVIMGKGQLLAANTKFHGKILSMARSRARNFNPKITGQKKELILVDARSEFESREDAIKFQSEKQFI